MKRPAEPIVTGYGLEVIEGELERVYSPHGPTKSTEFVRFNDSFTEVFRANADTIFTLRARGVEIDDLYLGDYVERLRAVADAAKKLRDGLPFLSRPGEYGGSWIPLVEALDALRAP